MQFPELWRRISEVLGFPLPNVVSYHKLCDFKPFYGLAFADLLKTYRYWGYCDVDLFFGDLQPLVEAAESEKFDFISPWDYTAGFCTLLRNETRVNQLGLKIPNLRMRAFDPDTTFMDEGGISETAVRVGGFTFGVIGDVSREWHRVKPFLGATALYDGQVVGMPGWVLLHKTDGRVILYDDDLQSHEALFFHFMGMKAARFWCDLDKCDPNQFSFTSYGIVPGLLDPSSKHSTTFRARCLRTHLAGYLYRSVRNHVPTAMVGKLKKWSPRTLRL
jgi:hypothetical protein